MTLAVEGLRVLDLARLLPGGLCTQYLADFGAEVIKVEEPERGDYARWNPPFVKGAQVSYRHLMLDRNKKSITLNLKAEKGREVFYKLAATADVILEGFRPKVVDRLGIGYETISKINPRIIYCSLSGYGQSGPYEQLVGHDVNYLSIAGVMGLIGQKGGPPVLAGVQIADIGGGGLMALVGILLALLARERTGRGQYVDIAMLDGSVGWLYAAAAHYFAEGWSPQRGELRVNGAYACYNIYECKDGKHFSVGAVEPQFWANLCRALGREDLIEHQYNDERREEILAWFRQAFKQKTRDEWWEQLKPIEICLGPVYTMEETFSDPQVLHRQLLVTQQHPQYGELKHIGVPIKLSDTPGQIRAPAPGFGEHTDAILKELGYAGRDIAALREAKVIR